MRKLTHSFVLVLVFGLVSCSSQRVQSKTPYLGRWTIAECRSGSDVLSEIAQLVIENQGLTIEFTKTKIVVETKAREIEFNYTIVPRLDYFDVDIIDQQFKDYGILKVNEQNMYLCFPQKSGRERPIEFGIGTRENANTLVVLKKCS